MSRHIRVTSMAMRRWLVGLFAIFGLPFVGYWVLSLIVSKPLASSVIEMYAMGFAIIIPMFLLTALVMAVSPETLAWMNAVTGFRETTVEDIGPYRASVRRRQLEEQLLRQEGLLPASRTRRRG